MTTFGDQVYQHGGSPVGHGLPVTFGNTQNAGAGRTFFVNPTTGSDGNTGLKMTKPFATIAKAYASTLNNNHDNIVLSASSGHAAADELVVSNSRTHFLGLDAVGRYYGQRSRWTMGVTSGLAIGIVKNTGVGNSFSNIKFDSSDTLATSLFAFAEGGEYTVIENCEIYKSSLLNNTNAAELLMNGDSSLVRNCTIGSNVNAIVGAIRRPNVMLTRDGITGKVSRDSTFENCLFWKNAGDVANTFVWSANANDVERMLLFKDCVFFSTKLSVASPAVVVLCSIAPTDGYVLLKNCTSIGSTKYSAVTGVFVDGAVATGATTGLAVQAA